MTEEIRGIPRAREILAKIETTATPGRDATPVIGAMALHASAIAAVELASATQLGALANVLRADTSANILNSDERIHVIDTIRALLGMPALSEVTDG